MKTKSALAGGLLLIFVSALCACHKDKESSPTSFSEIGLSHIKSKEALMTEDPIAATNATGKIWKTDDVIIFKNHLGVYGKIRVLGMDENKNYELLISAVTFKSDGSVAKQIGRAIIRGTWSCDLDILAETSDGTKSDFHWSRQNQTDTWLSPTNGATFAKYEF